MALPMRTFWFMSNSIERILAQKDMRALTVAVCGQSSEAAIDHREKLVLELGPVVEQEAEPFDPMNAERDQAGVDELKAMGAIMK